MRDLKEHEFRDFAYQISNLIGMSVTLKLERYDHMFNHYCLAIRSPLTHHWLRFAMSSQLWESISWGKYNYFKLSDFPPSIRRTLQYLKDLVDTTFYARRCPLEIAPLTRNEAMTFGGKYVD